MLIGSYRLETKLRGFSANELVVRSVRGERLRHARAGGIAGSARVRRVRDAAARRHSARQPDCQQRTMTPVTNPTMPMEKVRALSDEVDAAASLLRHGLTLLASYTFASRDADAVFVCLAGGAEKLLKLSAGLYALEASGSWPSKSTMKGFGHDIVELHSHVRGLIVQGAPTRSTAPGYMAELLDKVDNDPTSARC